MNNYNILNEIYDFLKKIIHSLQILPIESNSTLEKFYRDVIKQFH